MTKPASHRFVFLDGMRGVAAAAVVALHAAVIFKLPVALPNAGLAVDFFFCLSGFVVAQAYDEKLATNLGFRGFLWRRFKRLYPMIFLGTVLGIVAGLATGWKLAADTVAALALIPVAGVLAFPLNFPMWSLFFEVLANIGFGLGSRWVGTRLLVVGTAATGVALAVLIFLAGHVNTFGVGGHSLALGLPRVAYSFGAGVLICRLGLWRHAHSMRRWVLAVGLAAVLFMPGEDWAYQAAVVLFGGPAFVILGAATAPKPSRGWTALGNLSYPLYLVHVPALFLIFRAMGPGLADAVAGAALSILAAQAALILFDQPARRRLGRLNLGAQRSVRTGRVGSLTAGSTTAAHYTPGGALNSASFRLFDGLNTADVASDNSAGLSDGSHTMFCSGCVTMDPALPPSFGPGPEPVTWALLIQGFSGVGAAMRRQEGRLGFA